ncbi:hypothetical protein SISNIDRAFT_482931 [Sistotremastrum niveocremeum HHB9708]|uniref:GOLD domain-containing protein n=2 Tax=Sistotremastraceae TaxID=3402574 RepID=A0A164XWH5_9AGAM|nr:hypothetical protein SISNIDRAFT_482931 [Sistotremastrum niveocremeum HHB9708]KZT36162.1 hypothetical protein SISSUDRAFT_1071627 [Sistotremastrum suecicum HHB10207 ss-3]
MPRPTLRPSPIFLVFLLLLPLQICAIKFVLPSTKEGKYKCIWNPVHDNALVIVTANIGPGHNQRVDIEIIDSSPKKNVYLSKKDIKGEARFAVTSHAEGEVGVCLSNTLYHNAQANVEYSHVIDLDIDIGAEAVDYNAIANQESLSGLETEMRKLEGLVSEIVEELGYLKTREQRFSDTNNSTNKRVQNFGLLTIFILLCLGAWQILHLRSFFRRKYLID